MFLEKKKFSLRKNVVASTATKSLCCPNETLTKWYFFVGYYTFIFYDKYPV